MADWFEQTVGGTRGEILRLLRRSDRSVGEMAEALGISHNAVRAHLAAMQRDGMVETAGVERATGGKPAQLYRITQDAEELFPKAYAVVLGELIRAIEEREGRDAAVALLREVGARAGSAHRIGAPDPEARVERAAAVLRQLGGDVEVRREEAGWMIQGHGCPLSAVVADHGEICSLAVALIQEITGRSVTECCAREGRPRCAFRVDAVGGAPRPARAT